jgi:hypothetical protein
VVCCKVYAGGGWMILIVWLKAAAIPTIEYSIVNSARMSSLFNSLSKSFLHNGKRIPYSLPI